MKAFISPGLHGIMDYIMGVVVTASPWLFGFVPVGGAALFIPVVFGALLCIMSIFTANPKGLFPVIPFQVHLVIDMFVGFLLFVSPFLYGFYPFVVLPHVLLGLLLMGAGIFTQPSPFLDDDLNVLDPRGF
jgi:hypothetical protein